MKNKGMTGIIILLVIIFLVGSSLSRTYNRLGVMEESVDASWSEVENQLKRRADLIPNLLETVKGYAAHESEVIKNISDARAGYSSAHTPEEYAKAEAEFNKALRGVNIVVENYPDLKANENFKDFQTDLAGTENRIATARMRYNEEVKSFNSNLRRFPTNIVAGLFGFEKKSYFEINESDRELPKVKF